MMGKIALNTILKSPKKDHELQERAIQASELDWVIIRPPRLTNEAARGTYRIVLEDERKFTGSQISRDDVAHCLLRALHEDSWITKALSISD